MSFAGVTHITDASPSSVYADMPPSIASIDGVSGITVRFRVGESILFANAYRIKAEIVGIVKIMTKAAPITQVSETDRLWNQPRRQDDVAAQEETDDRPLSRQVILDMAAVSHIDTTGIQALMDLKSELHNHAGHAAIVFIGTNIAVRRRFERASWALLKGC